MVAVAFQRGRGRLATVDHCSVRMSITSTGAFLSSGPHPPATISDVLVVATAGALRRYVIGGNCSIHFCWKMPGLSCGRMRRVFVALYDCFPPIAVSFPLTTAMEKYSLWHSGRTVHCPVLELNISTLVKLTPSAQYTISPSTATECPKVENGAGGPSLHSSFRGPVATPLPSLSLTLCCSSRISLSFSCSNSSFARITASFCSTLCCRAATTSSFSRLLT
ncbi:hypothetical protein GBAR_LOCUS2635 [Geodia barretti]|uniref:Uncharacterized protein n=1 Tax=Geodia barretti TaxID=519541 RepID=A0AA35R1H7_GEOBA|nr:hypothetical protein GBAR_LOCUS2635 [Geodia barretti]